MANDPKTNKGVGTTGHEWDGIQEYNNPLPRWWVWVFLGSVIFAAGYALYYPMLPGGKPTVSGWTSLGQLNAEVAAGEGGKKVLEDRLASTDVLDIQKDPDLRAYATAAGKSLFAMNCSQCHGAGGAGAKGFPNLLDDEWIHGGSLSAIAFTITHGIRNTTDPEARNPGSMMAFGKDGLLTAEQVKDVVNYLSVLSRGLEHNDSTKRGEQVFADNCASCHGAGGEGNREMGAPPLNNMIWLYGGSNEDRTETVMNGRAGVMPAWGQKLTANDIKKLAVYVHGLGGGEAEAGAPAAAPAVEASATTVSATAQ